jgi:hypothetical protein
MTPVTCVLHETVILRDHGVCLQLVGLDDQAAQVAVTSLPSSAPSANQPSTPRSRCKQNIKGRMHAAAEALQALHEQLEDRPEDDPEPLILKVYHELRDADRELDWLDRLSDSCGPIGRPCSSECP